jgi:hypothetical protein
MLNLHVFLALKTILKTFSAMFSTIGPEMAQKYLNGLRKSICRSW